MVMVMYFAPSFGLFDLLNHLKWEQIQFAVRKESKLLPEEHFLHLYNITPLPWSELDRWNYEDPVNPTPPNYKIYTGYGIGQYFKFFWFILFFNTFLNIIVKCIFSKKFRDEATNLEIFVHGFENCNFPTPWRDWDERSGKVQEHVERFKMVRLEILGIMFVNFITSGLMLMPMYYTGNI